MKLNWIKRPCSAAVTFISSHKVAVICVLGANLFLFTLAYSLFRSSAQGKMVAIMDELQHGFLLFGIVRCSIEIFVLINWRPVIAFLKRHCNLGCRKTWFVLQCRSLFKILVIFDVGTLLLMNVVLQR